MALLSEHTGAQGSGPFVLANVKCSHVGTSEKPPRQVVGFPASLRVHAFENVDAQLPENAAEAEVLATVAKDLGRRTSPASQSWRTFLANHVSELASIDFFTVPSATFRVLFVFVVLSHDRRRIVAGIDLDTTSPFADGAEEDRDLRPAQRARPVVILAVDRDGLIDAPSLSSYRARAA